MSTHIEFNDPVSISYVGNTISHDISNSLFADGGSDIFDSWGAFTIKDSSSNELLIPIDNTDNGTTNTFPFTLGVGSGSIKYGFIHESVYFIEIIPDDPQWTYDLTFGGNYGSDNSTQHGSVFRDISEDTYRIWLHWNNDNSIDTVGGDPQWMYVVLPNKKVLSNSFTQPYSSVYTTEQDEVSTCIGLTETVRFYGIAGGSTTQALDLIENQVRVYDDYYKAITILNPTRYWRLGETSGTVAIDVTGNCDGTYINSPTLGADSLTTDENTSVEFTSSSYVQCAESGALISDGVPFSVSLLIKRSSAHDSHLINIPDGADSWLIANVAPNRSNYGDIAFGSSSGWYRGKVTLSSPIADGVVYHLVISYNGENRGSASSYSVYVDGVLQTIEASANMSSEASSNFYIGKRGSKSSNGFNGSIDDVAFFNYELTGVLAQSLYNSSVPKISENMLFNAFYFNSQNTYIKSDIILDRFYLEEMARSLATRLIASSKDSTAVDRVSRIISNSLYESLIITPTDITSRPHAGLDKHVSSDAVPTYHMRNMNTMGGAYINGSLVKDYFIGEDRVYGNITRNGVPTVGKALLFDQNNMQLIAQQSGTSYDFYNIDDTLTYMLIVYHVDNPEIINPVVVNNISLAELTYTPYMSKVIELAPFSHYELSTDTIIADHYNNYPGTIHGTIAVDTAIVSQEEASLLFNGNDTYIDFDAAAATINTLDEMTIVCWIRTSNSQSGSYGGMVFSMHTNAGEGSHANLLRLGIYTNGKTFIGINSASVTYPGNSLVDGNPHMMVVTISKTIAPKYYLDGVELTISNSTVPLDTVGRISIGQEWDSTPGDYFDGSISQVSMYDKTLTAQQVSDLYTLGTS